MGPRIKIVVITLEAYPTRLELLTPELELLKSHGFAVEIVYGVNGNDITIRDSDEPHVKLLQYRDWTPLKYDSRVRINGQGMSCGELGCAWSHHHVYQRLIADTDADMYLVLEDDASRLCAPTAIVECLRNLPPYFDVLRTTPSTWYPFIKDMEFNAYFYTATKQYSNFATSYVVTKKGAHKLIGYAAGRLDIPADDLLSEMYIHTTATYYVSDPAWFVDPRTQPSLIATVTNSSQAGSSIGF